MSTDGKTAKNQLSAAPPKAWDRDFRALGKEIQELQEVVGEINATYLKRPWTAAEVGEVRHYSVHNEILNNIRQIAEYRIDDFYKKDVSSDELKARYFEDEKEAIEKIIELAGSLADIPQSTFIAIPQSTLIQLRDSSYKLAENMHNMRDFCTKPKSKNTKIGDEALGELEKQKENLVELFFNNYRDFFDASVSLKTSFNDQKIHELTELVYQLTDEKTESVINKHNELYSDRASKHFWASLGWVAIAFLLLVITCGFAIHTLGAISQIASDANKYIILSSISVRVFIFGLLASVTFWSFKNYRLNKHNELLNRQKEIALKTFTEFSNASGTDQDMRKIIIGKIAGTIFDAQSLGYLGRESHANESVQAMDLVTGLLRNKE